MAEENQGAGNVNMESSDRGLFDFMKKSNDDDCKKDDQQHLHVQEEEVIAAEFQEKVEVSAEDHHHDHHNHKLHRSDSSSSSSSDEEEGDDEEKKRRKKEKKEKKGLKEKIKEKLPGHKDDTTVPIEMVQVEEVVYSEPSHPPVPPHHQEAEAEKKGLLEKIKDKLPGQHKKADGDHAYEVAPTPTADVDCQEKKGFLEKIKEKIPGFHPKSADQEVEKRDCTEPTSST